MAEKEPRVDTLPGLDSSDSPGDVSTKLFSFPQFDQLVEELIEAIHREHFLILCVGEPGCGKSSLLKKLIVDEMVREPNLPICHIQIRPEVSEGDILRQIGHHFGITDGGADLPFDILAQHLRAPHEYEHHPLLILDDAQLLTTDQIRTLLKLEGTTFGDGQKTMTLVLFGEPALMDRIRDPQLDLPEDADLFKLDMPYLPMDEVEAYIEERLDIPKGTFSQEQLVTIHKKSFGIPGQVNHIVADLQNEDAPHEEDAAPPPPPVRKNQARKKSRQSLPKGLLAALASALILALLYFAIPLFQQNRRATPNHTSQTNPRSPTPKEAPSGNGQTTQAETVDTAKEPATDRGLEQPGEQDVAPTDVAPTDVAPTDVAVSDAAEGEKPQPQPEPTPQNQPEPESRTTNSSSGTITIGTKSSKTTGESPGSPDHSVLAPGASSPEEIKREGWLLSQDPETFTIQIMGIRWEDRLLKFVAQHNLYPNTAYYKAQIDGHPWYPLLYGKFPTSEEARAAIKSLPQEIQTNSPWVRNMSSVQAAVREELRRSKETRQD